MSWVIKLAGLALVFFACVFVGVYKSSMLKKRENILGEIKGCMDELSVRLLYEGSEKNRIIERVFYKKGIITLESGNLKVLPCGINDDDKKLLEEFLCLFGGQDTDSEYKRIKLYTELLERNLKEASEKSAQLSRLYRTLGICTGIAVCLILV